MLHQISILTLVRLFGDSLEGFAVLFDINELAAFTVALAEELKNDGISAIALAPSTLDTPANRKDMPTAKHDTWVKPTAIAELIVAHCSLSEPINSGALMPVYGKA